MPQKPQGFSTNLLLPGSLQVLGQCLLALLLVALLVNDSSLQPRQLLVYVISKPQLLVALQHATQAQAQHNES
jgi:hypothetical protein